MKFRPFSYSCLLVSLFALGACGDRTQPTDEPEDEVPSDPPAQAAEVDEEEPAAEEPEETAAAPDQVEYDMADISTHFNFTALIPQDFQSYQSVDAGKFRELLRNTSMYRQTLDLFGFASGVEVGDPGDEINEPIEAESRMTQVFQLLTQGEIFFATGPQTASQTTNLLKFYHHYQRSDMEDNFTLLAEELGLMEAEEEELEFFWYEDPLTKMLRQNPEMAINLVEAAQMPTLMMGFEIKENRDAALDLLAEMDATLSMDMPPEVEKEEIEEDGLLFILYNFETTDMISLEEAREAFDMLDEAQLERLHAAITSKTICFGFGMKGDYLVYFAGTDKDALSFAESPEDSVLANPEFAFVAKHKDENLLGVTYAEESLLNSIVGFNDISYMTQAFINVVQRSTAVGDTRDIVALVERIEANARKFLVPTHNDSISVLFEDEGIRFESLGGNKGSEFDSSSPLHFAPLTAKESTAILYAARSADWVNPLLGETVEDLLEVASQLTERYGVTEEAMAEHSEQIEFLTTVAFPTLKELNVAFGEAFLEGLGNESALVLDLAGAMPKFPEMPPEFLDEAKIPRMAFVYTVEDREKLGSGWENAEPAITRLIEGIAEQMGAQFTLPDHMDSERAGIITYSYPFTGITNNDFIPSASVSDDLFFLSSSRTLSESIAEYLTTLETDEAEEEQPLANQWFINLELIQEYAAEMVDLTEKHFADPNAHVDEFFHFDGYGFARSTLLWTEDLKKFEGKAWHEGNRLRQSWHLHFDTNTP